jgi:hypothetical protein
LASKQDDEIKYLYKVADLVVKLKGKKDDVVEEMLKAKAVPLHATKALGGRKYIARTHS